MNSLRVLKDLRFQMPEPKITKLGTHNRSRCKWGFTDAPPAAVLTYQARPVAWTLELKKFSKQGHARMHCQQDRRITRDGPCGYQLQVKKSSSRKP